MKNKVNLRIVILIISFIAALIIFFLSFNNLRFNTLEYDIIVEKHRYQYEGWEFPPSGGYSTNYFYTVINSEKKEKYTLTYQNIWDIHNQRGDVDIVTIEIESISDSELNESINNFGKSEENLKFKDLFEQEVKEKYKIKFE